MKKIYLAALTLAMTACVSNDDLNPVDNYGYIDVNVSNDPVMVTRAVQNVGNISSWTITTQKGTNTSETWSSEKAYEAGNYTVVAQNYVDESAWKGANDNYGAAFYQGEKVVEVKAGETAPAKIECGKAKNAKLTVTIANMPTAFSDVTLTAVRDNSTRLTFTKENNKEAFFGASETVTYSLSYKYNSTNKAIENQSITMRGAATNNVITISANDNGLISVTITYDDSFTEGNSSTLKFDAATGEKVTTPSQG